MAEVTINNSPVHSQSIITYPYGVADPNYSCGYHTGIDFAPYGSTGTNPMLYSVVTGEVVQVVTSTTGALRSTSADFIGYWRLLAILSYGRAEAYKYK